MGKFHYQSLLIHLHPKVYEPAEDTFLLLDSINVKPKEFVLEIGTGTGIISLFCAKKGAVVICSDINPYAIELTKKNIDTNKEKLTGSIQVRQGTLFSPVQQNELFDLIIFNPPYLPTKKDEFVDGNGWFDKSVSGGKNGLAITEPFINDLSNHLNNNGRAFNILSTKSPSKRFNYLLQRNNLQSSIVSNLSFTDETIEVHKITKIKK